MEKQRLYADSFDLKSINSEISSLPELDMLPTTPVMPSVSPLGGQTFKTPSPKKRPPPLGAPPARMTLSVRANSRDGDGCDVGDVGDTGNIVLGVDVGKWENS